LSYYHDERMEKLFELLKQPKTLDEIDLPQRVIKNLILKTLASRGSLKTSQLNELTGLHFNILEEVLGKMDKEGLCSQTAGGFLFASVEYTIKKKGVERANKLTKENPYVGMAPVVYDEYFDIMKIQLKGRYPLYIPQKVVKDAFKDVIGVELPKEILVEAAIGGKGFFIYGPPGTGKTYLTSKMSNLLPPLVMPKFIEFNENIIQLFDPDFHKLRPEQPEDPRWVKIYAPFVFTGSELTKEKMETNYNPNRGVYDTSPIIKANGGVLLLDDLGRQSENPNALLNRLIVPLENKQDIIYLKGSPVVFHSYFIPALSTNLDISIIDEAHLRRAPIQVALGTPSIDEIVEVFKKNLDEMDEKYDEKCIERFRRVYTPDTEGGERLKPTFAHARDIAQIAQAVRVMHNEDMITEDIVDKALERHILVYLQRKYTPEIFERIFESKASFK
jgi:predicted ATPase with chaperone activity